MNVRNGKNDRSGSNLGKNCPKKWLKIIITELERIGREKPKKGNFEDIKTPNSKNF